MLLTGIHSTNIWVCYCYVSEVKWWTAMDTVSDYLHLTVWDQGRCEGRHMNMWNSPYGNWQWGEVHGIKEPEWRYLTWTSGLRLCWWTHDMNVILFICPTYYVYQGKVNIESFLDKSFINLLNGQKTLFKHPPLYTMS